MTAQQDSILVLDANGHSLTDVHLSTYYRENFFSGDSMWHPEVVENHGVAGEPVPYAVVNDSFVTALLLLCLVVTLFYSGTIRPMVVRRFREMLFPSLRVADDAVVPPAEMRMKRVLVLQTCLLGSVVFYFFTKSHVPGPFLLDSDYLLILVFMVMLLGFVLLKMMCYTVVNDIFFGSKKNKQFLQYLIFLIAFLGVLALPVVFLLVYFGISVKGVVFYFAFLSVIGEILVFYKGNVIFFRQKGGFLQNILYFCALEIVPVALLVGAWTKVIDLLKINF